MNIVYRNDFEAASPTRPLTAVLGADGAVVQPLELVTEDGNTFVRSTGQWWNDPNHTSPGAGWLNLVAYDYFRHHDAENGVIGAPGQTIDLRGATYSFKVRLEGFTLPEGAHLYFWFQARDTSIPADQGQVVNYMYTAVAIDEAAASGEWTTITIELSTDDSHWTALGSAWFKDSLYSASETIAKALATGNPLDCGIIIFLGDNYWEPATGSVSFDDFVFSVANDAPTSANQQKTIVEDTAYTVAIEDIAFADHGNALSRIAITELPSNGTLYYDPDGVGTGEPAVAIDAASAANPFFVTEADVEAGRLYYSPDADWHGPPLDGFKFKVEDDGGTDGFGVNLSAEYSFGFNVSYVNDAPDLALDAADPDGLRNAFYLPGDDPVLLAPDGLVADPDSANFDFGRFVVSFAGGATSEDRLGIVDRGGVAGAVDVQGDGVFHDGVRFGTVSGGGNVALSVLLNENATPAAVTALLRQITYSNVSASPSLMPRKFEFTVSDGDGATSSIATAIVRYEEYDAPPIARSDAVATTEAGPISIAVLANDADADGPALSVAQIDGQAVAAGQAVTLSSGATARLNADGTITYDPNGRFGTLTAAGSGAVNLSAADGFTYKLANGTATATVAVTVNGLASADDVLAGDAGANAITGTAGADRIEAGDGEDTLDGRGGADSLAGGGGNDLYLVRAADGAFQGTIVELAGGGTDEVRTDLASLTIAGAPEVELLTGTRASGQTLTGNSLANTIRAGAGADTIEGGAGDDLIDGGGGADRMRGGAGNDVYVVDSRADSVTEAAMPGTDEVRTGLASFSLAPFAYVENLTGTSDAGQTLTGSGAANVITGGAGNDVLIGGAGADTLRGGAGNDVYFVDLTGELVVEAEGGGTDEIRTAISSYSMAGNAHVEKLTGTSNGGQMLTGNDQANVISAGTGADRINGGGGDDVILGGVGADTLRGSGGADIFRFLSYAESRFTSFDAIQDFAHGTDRIDVSAFDANVLAVGAQDFTFIGSAAFTGAGAASAGELRASVVSGSLWKVEGDLDGNGVGDFYLNVTVEAGQPLTIGDFIL